MVQSVYHGETLIDIVCCVLHDDVRNQVNLGQLLSTLEKEKEKKK